MISEIKKLGDFEILREVGRGGMGVVYEARQVSLGRRVALKVILGLGRNAGVQVERFRREAASAAKLAHPNITQVYAYGEADGQHYIAMEFVDGRPLDDLLRDAASEGCARPEPGFTPPEGATPDDATMRIPASKAAAASRAARDAREGRAAARTPGGPQLRRFVRLLHDAARALHAAHEAGVLHRDIKPANMLIGSGDVVKLADFGLARTETSGDTLTSSGEMMGTLQYMAPEQLGAEKTALSRRTDIYALGVTLYEILVGRRPFDAPSAHQLIQQIRLDEPLAPRKAAPGCPRDLETVCLKAMEKDPEARYPTALEFAEDLERFLNGEPVLACPQSSATRVIKFIRRRRIPLAVGAVLIIAGSVALMASASARSKQRELDRDAAQRKLITSLMRPLGGSNGDAVQLLNEAQALDPSNANILLQRGLMRIFGDAFDAAVADFDAGLKLEPGDPGFLFAKAAATRLSGKDPSPPPKLDTAKIKDPIRLTALGMFMILSGRIKDAEEPFEAAKRLDPSMAQSRFGLALTHFNLRRHELALRTISTFLELVPKHAVGRMMVVFAKCAQARNAVGLRRAELVREARAAFAEARRDAPDEPLVAVGCPLIDSVDDVKKRDHAPDQCLAQVEKMLNGRAKDALQVSGSIVYEILALVALDENPVQARDYAQKAIAIRKGTERAPYVLAALAAREGRLEDAAQICRDVLREVPDSPLAASLLLDLRLRKPELVPDAEAVALAQKILGLLPEEPAMMVSAGNVLASLGQNALAEKAYEMAETLYGAGRDKVNEERVAESRKRIAED